MTGNEEPDARWTEGAAALLTILITVVTLLAGLGVAHRSAASDTALIAADGKRPMILVPYPRR